MTEWDLVPHLLFVCLFGMLANYWLPFIQLLKVYEKSKTFCNNCIQFISHLKKYAFSLQIFLKSNNRERGWIRTQINEIPFYSHPYLKKETVGGKNIKMHLLN